MSWPEYLLWGAVYSTGVELDVMVGIDGPGGSLARASSTEASVSKIPCEPDRVLTGALIRGFIRGEGEPSGTPRARKCPPELIERGVRLALESGRPIAHVGRDLGIAPETFRKAVRQAEADSGRRGDLLTSEERKEIKKLRRENFELRRANEILKSASVCFAKELDPDRTK